MNALTNQLQANSTKKTQKLHKLSVTTAAIQTDFQTCLNFILFENCYPSVLFTLLMKKKQPVNQEVYQKKASKFTFTEVNVTCIEKGLTIFIFELIT